MATGKITRFGHSTGGRVKPAPDSKVRCWSRTGWVTRLFIGLVLILLLMIVGLAIWSPPDSPAKSPVSICFASYYPMDPTAPTGTQLGGWFGITNTGKFPVVLTKIRWESVPSAGFDLGRFDNQIIPPGKLAYYGTPAPTNRVRWRVQVSWCPAGWRRDFSQFLAGLPFGARSYIPLSWQRTPTVSQNSDWVDPYSSPNQLEKR